MSKAIYLDPAKTDEYKPHEEDRRTRYEISPFDVPLSMGISGPTIDNTLQIDSIKFQYAGGENGSSTEDLKINGSPEIRIESSRSTGKILEINFGYPVDFDELLVVSHLLEYAATKKTRMAQRFNYQMIAAILKHWREFVPE